MTSPELIEAVDGVRRELKGEKTSGLDQEEIPSAKQSHLDSRYSTPTKFYAVKRKEKNIGKEEKHEFHIVPATQITAQDLQEWQQNDRIEYKPISSGRFISIVKTELGDQN